MKTIQLTQGKVALVDDADYEWLNQWKWYAFRNPTIFYAGRSIIKNGVKKMILMHRIIINAKKDKMVDHKDHDGLNNQRYNIRACTRSQNMQNQSSGGSSKYLGVGWVKSANKWESRIKSNDKRKFLGHFKTELEAAIIYNIAARKYHGEFANPNKFV